jgi:hypothetical protein
MFLFRTLAEFWHWFVANIPGDSLDEGEVVFDLLFPLVLPDGNGDHRLAINYFLLILLITIIIFLISLSK